MNNTNQIFTYLLFLAVTFCVSCSSSSENQDIQGQQAFEVELETVRAGYNPDTLWAQAYIATTPPPRQELFVTLNKYITGGIDNYGSLYYCKSTDMGETWTEPMLLMERTPINDSMDMVLSDVYPLWHEKTGKILATGKLFYYLNERTDDPEVARGVGYTVYDPVTESWSELQTLKMPTHDHTGALIFNPSAGCNQRYDLPNGNILLPVYYLREDVPEGLNVSTIVHCSFDGETLTYIEHGDEMSIPRDRGLGETSITRFNDEYFVTLRADHSAFVSKGTDGLHFQELKEWTFDNDSILGSYNTQQHWATHSDSLYLIYTRRGANNDHVFRHRAPLFMGQVDPEKLQVIRATETAVVPEKGARLGNFGVTPVNENITAISTSERMQKNSVQYGADNRVYVSKIHWNKPNALIPKNAER